MTTHTRREHETKTPLFITRVSDVELAGDPDDGGKWIIYCDHFDAQKREFYNAGILQDTDKRRLASWCRAKRGAGFTTWCPECQEANDLWKKAGG